LGRCMTCPTTPHPMTPTRSGAWLISTLLLVLVISAMVIALQQ
jgi:hypothetical protein